MWHTDLKDKNEVVETRRMLYDSMCVKCQMPRNSDNRIITEEPMVPALNLKFGHFITQNILYSHLSIQSSFGQCLDGLFFMFCVQYYLVTFGSAVGALV